MRMVLTPGVRRALLAGLAGAGVAGCGSTSSTTTEGSASTVAPTTATSSTSTAPTSASSSASTPTGGGPPSVGLLHSVTSNAGVDLRLNGSGGWHSVAMLPANSFVWDVSHGEVLAFESSNSAAVVVDLTTGASHNVASGVTGVGGAISPDGTKVAYLATGSGGGFELRVSTIATGTSQVLATYSTGPVPDPLKWGADGILADLIVPNSDAPTQGASRIDPSNGHELARSSGIGQHGLLACGDGDHVLAVDHTSGLGDDGDVPPGPGPQGNPNTLRLVTVGGTQTIIKKAAHHQIQALACPSDGSIAVFQDGSSAGGFAGITLSADFGLFLVQNGAATQLDHYGTTYDSAAVYQDGASVAAAKTDSSGSTFVELGPSHPFGSDNVAGATGGRVDLVFFGG